MLGCSSWLYPMSCCCIAISCLLFLHPDSEQLAAAALKDPSASLVQKHNKCDFHSKETTARVGGEVETVRPLWTA